MSQQNFSRHSEDLNNLVLRLWNDRNNETPRIRGVIQTT